MLLVTYKRILPKVTSSGRTSGNTSRSGRWRSRATCRKTWLSYVGSILDEVGDEQTTFSEYIERMPVNATKILYLSGDSREQALNSPVIQRLIKTDYEYCYYRKRSMKSSAKPSAKSTARN